MVVNLRSVFSLCYSGVRRCFKQGGHFGFRVSEAGTNPLQRFGA